MIIILRKQILRTSILKIFEINWQITFLNQVWKSKNMRYFQRAGSLLSIRFGILT